MIHHLVSYTLLGIPHAVSFWAMTERKYSERKTALIYSIFCILFISIPTISNVIFGDSLTFYAVGYILTIILAFVVFSLISVDPMRKKIFLFLSYANVFSILGCASILLANIFFKDKSELFVYYATNIMRTLMFSPVLFIYIRYFRPAIKTVSGDRRKTWYSVSVVSGLFLIVFASFMVLFYASDGNIAAYSTFFIVAVSIYISVLWIIFNTIKSMITERDDKLTKQNVEFLQESLNAAKENELYNKTIRHDFRHHNRNVAEMLRKGNIDKALQYIDEYEQSLDDAAAAHKEFCPHVTLNAILGSFYSKAQREGIPVSVFADIQESVPVSDMDFVAICSNILENALNGYTEAKKGGEITVNVRTVADKIVIVCSNPCKDVEIENNMIKKKGVGISSVLIAVRKYNGDISYRIENGILTVCVILKI